MRRTAAALGLVAVTALTLAGCGIFGTTTPEGESIPADDTASAPRATAQQRTITDVLTVPATVVGGTDFTVSAPVAGSLHRVVGGFEYRGAEDGQVRPLTIPPTAVETEPIVPLEVEVGAGTPILTVRDTALTMLFPVTPAQVLRVADRVPTATLAQIDGSTGPFACDLNDPRPTESNGAFRLSCRIPTDVPAVVGATGIVAMTLAEKEDVVALPLEAVAGTRTRGLVYLPDDPEPHEVTLGITDGAYVEITDGLSVGDTVLIPSPSILESR